MLPDEIAKVQKYLRTKFSNNQIMIKPPAKPDSPVEIYIGDEFIAVLYRDEDEGEVSFAVHMSILEIDLTDP